MNPTAYERALAREAAPVTRAQRRAASQARDRAERSQRRSRARIERALSQYKKEI
ncbi:hypothetical protein [Microbacterium paludicola]|uniref:hypothetical protein n=1 Tax=Microbacterium paludicola TaxID=300019 RepID=UPI001642BC37|nr:hypothetical protein [Microbacterium paludicola]